ncbi:hypothetical protein H0H92_011720 [Tricholoma furcatifolium]|nr:hypothetical protein H0H92_011720 [Tricholoma furcatifolium]
MPVEKPYDEEEMEDENDQEEHFISQDDILEEVVDDGDIPMDEDEGDEETSSGPLENNSVQIFPEHRKSVFAVAAHPTQPLAVSGGEDDLGYVWDITDGEIIVKLTGHADSVTCVAWSSDGEMVSTGGMDGKIRIWRRVGTENYRTWEFLTELQGPDEVMFLKWHPKGSVLLAGSNDSTLWLWQCKRIISACADGTLIFWDPRSPTPVFKLTPQDARFDLDGVTSLKVNPSSTLAVIGGASGGVRVISLSKGEVVGTLGGHAEGESIEAVEFVEIPGVGAAAGVAITGATDGKALIWDLSTMRLRATLEHSDAITKLLTHPAPNGYIVVSASADKTLRTWDARNGTLLREHKGHRAPVLDASLGLEGSIVVSAGDDGFALVFTTEAVED